VRWWSGWKTGFCVGSADTARLLIRWQIMLMITVFLCLALSAQDAPRPNPYRSQNRGTAPAARMVSPEVQPDGKVTFRLRAPKASEVTVAIGGKAQAMTKDASGLWTLTIGPLTPEIYTYTFSVDGVRMLDTANTMLKNGRALDASVVEVPGNPPRFDQLQNVPHGTVQIRKYTSTPLNRARKMFVYLPPQYDSEPGRKFPVLYLRHGSGDNEANWVEDGRADLILDNLLAQRKAVPMLIVMTNGDTDGTWLGGSSAEAIDALARELFTDIMPMVEKNYRVLPGRENRAITGLSMGGGQAFTIGLKNMDKFAWVGQFSSGLVSDAGFDLEKHLPGFLKDASVNKKLRLLFLSCGSEDPRYAGQLNLGDLLKKHNIRYHWFSTPGAHEWKVWRHSLAEFAKLAFQPK
jgi:enterochelin esterase-like enzyme